MIGGLFAFSIDDLRKHAMSVLILVAGATPSNNSTGIVDEISVGEK